MIKVFRVCTRNDGDAFASFSQPGAYDIFRECLSSTLSIDCAVPVSIETEDECGNAYQQVDLLGLTNDTFIAKDDIVEKYRSVLNADGKWIKIASLKDYMLYSVTTVIDIVDPIYSSIRYFNDSGKIMSIDEYVFRYSTMLHSSLLFRSSVDPYREILCTELFISSYRKIFGSGLEFLEIGSVSTNTQG